MLRQRIRTPQDCLTEDHRGIEGPEEIFGTGGSSLLNWRRSNDHVWSLDSLRDNLNKRMEEGLIRKKIKAVICSCTKGKTQALVESLHRHWETFTTALAIDTRHSPDALPNMYCRTDTLERTLGALSLTKARQSRTIWES